MTSAISSAPAPIPTDVNAELRQAVLRLDSAIAYLQERQAQTERLRDRLAVLACRGTQTEDAVLAGLGEDRTWIPVTRLDTGDSPLGVALNDVWQHLTVARGEAVRLSNGDVADPDDFDDLSAASCS